MFLTEVLLAVNIVPYGVSNESVQTGFAAALVGPCSIIYSKLRIFTIVIAFAGLLMAAYKVQMGGDLTGLGTQLVTTLLVAVSLNYLPIWILNAEITLGPLLLQDLGISVKGVMDNFIKTLANTLLETIAGNIVRMMLGFFFLGLMFMGTIAIIVIIIAFCIAAVVYVAVIVAFLVQIAVVYIGLAIMPMFMGMLLFDKTRETGFKYILGMVGILFWQLGWALGFMCIQSSFAFLNDALKTNSTLGAVNFIFGGIIAACFAIIQSILMWSVLTKAPGIMSAAIVSGAQVGTGMVGAGASSIMSAASTAGSAAMAVGGAAATAATGGAAAPAAAGAMSMGKKG